MSVVLYWIAAAAFLLVGAVALARPQWILDVRARFRPVHQPEILPGARRSPKFGAREIRVCGAALLFIAAALVRSLVT